MLDVQLLKAPETSVITDVDGTSGTLVVTGLAANVSADIEAGIASGETGVIGDMPAGTSISENINPNGTVKAANETPNDIQSGPWTATLTYDPPINNVGLVNVYGGVRSNTAVKATKTIVYSDGTTDSKNRDSALNDWFWVDTFLTNGKSVSAVTLSASNDLVVGGVTLGDNNLILSTQGVELTLTDDTDLAEFPVGQTVTQSGGTTPVSSAITNVAVESSYIVWTSDSSSEGWATSDSPSSPIGPNGITEAGYLYAGDGSRNSDTYRFYFSKIGVTITEPTQVTFNCGSTGGGNWSVIPQEVTVDSGTLPFTSTPGSNQYLGCTLTVPAGTTYLQLPPTLNDDGLGAQAGAFGNLVIDGTTYDLWVSSTDPGTTLTLTDDTNLANFRVGDAVQRAPITSPVFYTVCNPDGAPTVNASYTITETAVLDMTSTAFQSIPNNTLALPNGELYKQLIFDLLTTSGDFNINADTTGWTILSSVDGKTWVAESVMDPNGGSIRSVMTNQPNARYLVLGSAMAANAWNGTDNFEVQFNQALIDTWASGSFLPTQLPTSYDILVTAIDESTPSISTDGGSWSGTDGTGSNGFGGVIAERFAQDTYVSAVNANTITYNINTSLGDGYVLPLGSTLIFKEGCVNLEGSAQYHIYTSSDGINFTRIINKNNPADSSVTVSAPFVAITCDGNQNMTVTGTGDVGATFVTGPSFTTTGTVGSVDTTAKTMTFSASAGRWLVTEPGYQEDLKLNTKVASDDQVLADATLYTLMDAEGNVSDISADDPGYQAMVTNATINADFNIKFPALLGSGETPDEALPEGTQISVDIFASNVAGTDEALHGVTGASLTPIDTSPPDVPEGKFKPVIYTGNAPGSQSVTGVGFSPDLVWLKGRTEARGHQLYDTVRGATNVLNSNAPTAETSASNLLTSFDADGFSVGSDSGSNSGDMVAWCWDAGDTTVTNNEGTIESQVRSNGVFSIVSYSGDGVDGSVGHGLDNAPDMLILKCTNVESNWTVRHSDLISDEYVVRLNLDMEQEIDTNVNGALNDKTFVVKTGPSTGNQANRVGSDYIAYCWTNSPTQNFGSYTGNGSTNGPTIDCGFEPAFVMVKCATSIRVQTG